jgi:hypothetical protein
LIGINGTIIKNEKSNILNKLFSFIFSSIKDQ